MNNENLDNNSTIDDMWFSRILLGVSKQYKISGQKSKQLLDKIILIYFNKNFNGENTKNDNSGITKQGQTKRPSGI